jgi:hypothetical protein
MANDEQSQRFSIVLTEATTALEELLRTLAHHDADVQIVQLRKQFEHGCDRLNLEAAESFARRTLSTDAITGQQRIDAAFLSERDNLCLSGVEGDEVRQRAGIIRAEAFAFAVAALHDHEGRRRLAIRRNEAVHGQRLENTGALLRVQWSEEMDRCALDARGDCEPLIHGSLSAAATLLHHYVAFDRAALAIVEYAEASHRSSIQTQETEQRHGIVEFLSGQAIELTETLERSMIDTSASTETATFQAVSQRLRLDANVDSAHRRATAELAELHAVFLHWATHTSVAALDESRQIMQLLHFFNQGRRQIQRDTERQQTAAREALIMAIRQLEGAETKARASQETKEEVVTEMITDQEREARVLALRAVVERLRSELHASEAAARQHIVTVTFPAAHEALLDWHMGEVGRLQEIEAERRGNVRPPTRDNESVLGSTQREGELTDGGASISSEPEAAGGVAPYMSSLRPSMSGARTGNDSPTASVVSTVTMNVTRNVGDNAPPIADTVAKRVFGLIMSPPEAVVYDDGVIAIAMKMAITPPNAAVGVVIKNKHASHQIFGVSFGLVSKPDQLQLKASGRDVGNIAPGQVKFYKLKGACLGPIADAWPVVLMRCTVVPASSGSAGVERTISGDNFDDDRVSTSNTEPEDDVAMVDNSPSMIISPTASQSAGAPPTSAPTGPVVMSVPLPFALPTFMVPKPHDVKSFAAYWKTVGAANRSIETYKAAITAQASPKEHLTRFAQRIEKLLRMTSSIPNDDTAMFSGALSTSSGEHAVYVVVKVVVNEAKTLCGMRIEGRCSNEILEKLVVKQCLLLGRGEAKIATLP